MNTLVIGSFIIAFLFYSSPDITISCILRPQFLSPDLKGGLFNNFFVFRLKGYSNNFFKLMCIVIIFWLTGCASTKSESQILYDGCLDNWNEYKSKSNHKAMVAGGEGACYWSWDKDSTDTAINAAMNYCRSKHEKCYVFSTDQELSDWVSKISANGGREPGQESGRNRGLEFLGLFLFGAGQGYAAARGTSTPVIPYIPPTPSYSNDATGQSATHCVSLQQTSRGGMEIYNGCPDVVSVAWCVKGVDCNVGEDLYSNLWNVGVGKSWPVSGSRGNGVVYAACMGADVLIESRGDNQFVCRK